VDSIAELTLTIVFIYLEYLLGFNGSAKAQVSAPVGSFGIG